MVTTPHPSSPASPGTLSPSEYPDGPQLLNASRYPGIATSAQRGGAAPPVHPSPVYAPPQQSAAPPSESNTLHSILRQAEQRFSPTARRRPRTSTASAAPGPTRSPQARTLGQASNIQYLITGSCILVALLLMTEVKSLLPQAKVSDICQQIVQPESVLSRAQLTQLLSISERTNRTAIRNIVSEPYCQLSAIGIRAGATAEREAYPLAFDPNTWLVMLYEGDEYAGFDFSFRR